MNTLLVSFPQLLQSLAGQSGLGETLFARLALNSLAVLLLVRFIYFRIYRKMDLFLTFFVFNLIIFLITYLLNQVQLSIGAAFGLFAVFSMLRYRTEGLTAKDMTYLFVVIALGLIGAVSRGGLLQLGLLNGLILTCVYALESSLFFRREWSKAVQYDRLDLLQSAMRSELLEDLRARTGLPVHRIDIQEFDLLKDCAKITIYYFQHDVSAPIARSVESPVR